MKEDKEKKQKEKLEAEIARLKIMQEFEEKYKAFTYIAGVDEVGRGPLAGPVVASCVILDRNIQILYINDSKKLSEKKRESLYDEICEKSVAYGIGIVSPGRIDEINILNATYEAMKAAISSLDIKPDILLNDTVHIPDLDIKQVSIIKGDAKSISIAAASIVAKVSRDRLMVEYDTIYPEYKFAKNKGYGTKEHISAIKEHGLCPIHRRSFVGNIIGADGE